MLEFSIFLLWVGLFMSDAEDKNVNCNLHDGTAG